MTTPTTQRDERSEERSSLQWPGYTPLNLERRVASGESSGLVERAEFIATRAHASQFRRDGVTPYVRHPEAVAARLKREDDETVAAAWLHDTLEDTAETEQSLRESGIPEKVLDAVRLLTHRDEPYAEYLERIRANDIARKVKVADMLSNLSDAPTKGQVLKYARGLLILLGGGGAEHVAREDADGRTPEGYNDKLRDPAT